MKYFDELKRAMTWLGEKPDTIFLGQAVAVPGTAISNEDMQMGMSIGMSFNGYHPISIFPRWNFLLLATNQIVNHLDKISQMSDNPYKTPLIIRTAIGSERPLHPQHQHIGDYTNIFKQMCPNIDIYRVDEPEQIFDTYSNAYESKKPTLIIEWGDFYNEK